MKFLKIFLSLLVILILILAVGIFIFWQTFDINKYNAEITKQITKAIGRDAVIGKIELDLSLSNGATVNVSRLTIVDGKDFDYGNFLEIDSIDLNVDIWKFITKKQIEVTRVVVNSPHVNLIRLSDGRLNIPAPAPSNDKPADLSRLTIDSIRVKDGMITFDDRSVGSPLFVPITNLDLQINGFMFDRPVSFTAKWGMYSAENNFDVAGSFKVDETFKNFRLYDLQLNSRLSTISLDDLKRGVSFVPFIQHLKRLQGDISVKVPDFIVGSSGLKVFKGQMDLQGLVLDTPDIPVPLDNVSGSVNVTGADVELNNWILPLASGTVHFAGKVSDYWITRGLSADLKVEGLNIPELMKIIPGMVLPDGIGLAGKLKADLSLTGSAFSPDPDMIMKSLSAKGTVSVDDGIVQGFNLMQALMTRLDKLSQILGIGIKDEILAKLPEEYKSKLALNDTPIRQLEMAFNLKDQQINFHDAVLGVDEGSFLAKGNIDLAQNLSLTPQVFVSPALTKVFVRAVNDLEVLVGDDGRLSIPLLPYNGPVSQLNVLPDTNFLVKKLGTARLKKELKGVVTDTLGLPGDFVGAVLGGKNANSSTTDVNGKTTSDASQKQTIKSKQDSTPGQLIGGVLDKILGQ